MSEGHGRLILVVGPSGAGKDTIIGYCRARVSSSIIFPRRAITRAAGDASEDHESMSVTEFERRAAAGDFALRWQAHGLHYGVPASIESDLAAGRSVVVNVSRTVIAAARLKYPGVRIVLVTVSPDILAARLAARGRESGEAISHRINRAPAADLSGPDVVHIDNSGPPAVAGEVLRHLLLSQGAALPGSRRE